MYGKGRHTHIDTYLLLAAVLTLLGRRQTSVTDLLPIAAE
jgi:hypothetical protein